MSGVGIVGGLGPMAGAAFYQRLVELTPAKTDSDHLSVVLISDSKLPSRLEHLLEGGPSPFQELLNVVEQLIALGVDIIAIPSATTHAYFEPLQDAVQKPIVNLLSEVAAEVSRSSIRRLAVLATAATIQLKLYDKALAGICEVVSPDLRSQLELQGLVDEVKAGNGSEAITAQLSELLSREWSAGCDAVLLGCTEFHLLRIPVTRELQIIDATDVLARSVLKAFHRDLCADLNHAEPLQLGGSTR